MYLWKTFWKRFNQDMKIKHKEVITTDFLAVEYTLDDWVALKISTGFLIKRGVPRIQLKTINYFCEKLHLRYSTGFLIFWSAFFPHFPAFGNMRTRITPNTDTFYAVCILCLKELTIHVMIFWRSNRGWS